MICITAPILHCSQSVGRGLGRNHWGGGDSYTASSPGDAWGSRLRAPEAASCCYCSASYTPRSCSGHFFQEAPLVLWLDQAPSLDSQSSRCLSLLLVSCLAISPLPPLALGTGPNGVTSSPASFSTPRFLQTPRIPPHAHPLTLSIHLNFMYICFLNRFLKNYVSRSRISVHGKDNKPHRNSE